MRYGVFADVHGNLPAFEAVLTQLNQENIDHFICAGDLVGYGADPRKCIELVKSLNAACIAGNHDWGAVGKTDITHFNPIAKEAILWTRDEIRLSDKVFLNQLELTYLQEDFQMVHGLLPNPERFEYLTELAQAVGMFSFLESKLCFVGHTHVPRIFVRDEAEFYESDSLTITLDARKKYIVNVGSVGQPRDGNPQAAYCVYDSDLMSVTIKRVPYNIPEAQKRIMTAGLPAFLAQRLAVGQ